MKQVFSFFKDFMLRPKALVSLCGLLASLASIPSLAQRTGGGYFFTGAEIAAWQQRSVSGPYKDAGDAGANTPNDWSRIVLYSDDFRNSPADTGNTTRENLDIWTGYRYQYDSLGTYPIWQGIKLGCAAFRYAVTGDRNYGDPTRNTLLAQVRFTHPKHKGYYLGSWPTPSRSNANPSYESAAKEAVWLQRLLLAYDYTQDLFSASEQQEMEAYFKGSAWYLAGRIHNKLAQSLPDRLRKDYTRKIYKASPQGITVYADPIYPRFNEPAWPDGYGYTHRNADNSLGNRLTWITFDYNNRMYEKMAFIGRCGIVTGDTLLQRHAKQAVKEGLMFATYADGTYGEYMRNGDYNNPMQGAMLYGGLNLQSMVTLADAFARQGDYELYQFSSRDGAHNTVIPANGTPKSLYTMISRYARNCQGVDPIYFPDNSTINNRLDINNEWANALYSTRHVTWDANLAIANKYYQSPWLTSVYTRRAPGTSPLPGANYNSAARVWLCWGGTGAEYPGMLFQYGQMEQVPVYSVTCSAPQGLAATGITQGTAQLDWQASGANRYGYAVRLINGGQTTRYAAASAMLALTGLAQATAYQAQVAVICVPGDTSEFSAPVSFTTAGAPVCPQLTGVSIGAITQNSAQLAATAGTGVAQVIIDIQPVGGTLSSVTIAASALPFSLAGLSAGQAYEVVATSVCSFGNGVPTAQINFTTALPPCNQASGLRGTPTAPDTAVMSWQAAAGGASQYQLRLRRIGTTNWKFVVKTGTELQHKEADLLPGQNYEVQIGTTCQAGNNSGYTGLANFSMPLPPCPAVTGLAAVGTSPDQATVTFTNYAGAGATYSVQYKTVAATVWTILAQPVSASPISLTGLSAATAYQVRVQINCVAGNNSGYGADVSFSTQAIPVCNAAQSLAAGQISQIAAMLTWVGMATSYEVGYRVQGQGNFRSSTSAANSLSLSGLTAGTSYEVQVVAVCGSLRSAAVTSTFRTLAPLPACPASTGLAAGLITHQAAQLTFSGPAGVSGYSIRYRVANSQPWTTLTGVPAGTNLAGLQPSTNYEAQVQTLCSASYAAGQSGWSGSLRFSTLAAPCITPTGLSTRVLSADSMAVRFTPARAGQLSLITIAAVDSVSGRQYSTLGSQIKVGRLTPGVVYRVGVRSTCPAGVSGFSNVDTIAMPEGCQATGIVRKQVWQRVSTFIAGQAVPARLPQQVTGLAVVGDTAIGQAQSLTRVLSIVCAPATGSFRLMLASRGAASLVLTSLSDSTQQIVRIVLAQGGGSLAPAVELTRGVRYRLDVMNYASDSLSAFTASWQLPGAAGVVPISASQATTLATLATERLTDAKNTAVLPLLTLYPNPIAVGQAGYLAGTQGKTHLRLLDITGRQLAQTDLVSEPGHPLSLEAIRPSSPGLYVLEAVTQTGQKMVARWRVE